MGVSSTEAPNLKLTRDFENFQNISHLSPHSKYNWLTAELYNWKTFDNKMSTGILYKPQDFNPAKKYPIIFCIYENIADGINKYLSPELSEGYLNISFFC